jgi:hypothetical protein
MATVSPVISSVQVQGRDVHRVTWTGIVTGDTINAFGIAGDGPINGAVQIGGTFNGATVTLEVSVDGTTFFPIAKDTGGTTLSATAAALFDFATSAIYIRPKLTSGSANAVNVALVLRTSQ